MKRDMRFDHGAREEGRENHRTPALTDMVVAKCELPLAFSLGERSARASGAGKPHLHRGQHTATGTMTSRPLVMFSH
jgi:hypothetical protein